MSEWTDKQITLVLRDQEQAVIRRVLDFGYEFNDGVQESIAAKVGPTMTFTHEEAENLRGALDHYSHVIGISSVGDPNALSQRIFDSLADVELAPLGHDMSDMVQRFVFVTIEQDKKLGALMDRLRDEGQQCTKSSLIRDAIDALLDKEL